ncbi:MAG: hypothetical protein ABWZ16_10270 [Microbacterium sp.]|jgi:hypothetical protein
MVDWHPILAAVEGPTGVWRMIDAQGTEYGRVEIRRIMNGTETRYKAVWRGEVIGWATTLREACERVHRAYLKAHGPVSFAGYPDLGASGRR